MKMTRKTFIKKTTGALLVSIPAYSLLACSNDDSANGDPNLDPNQRDCAANGASAVTISSNHGHTLTVSKEDVEAGVEKQYSIQGGSGHNHTIRLTEDHFASLRQNNQITVESSQNSLHRHDVTVACA
ncbi:hypothetical protein [Flagellimonas myxillae]|uniref:hypothetical protein n=1 Tax=Flagellimonas myxillae TaxID=2942214 RepID=UPI00201EAA38|nr:hypothetical protein [Muricauda myxillae]MCL6266163.1 hypothetical protein [Muricauda myxillae]